MGIAGRARMRRALAAAALTVAPLILLAGSVAADTPRPKETPTATPLRTEQPTSTPTVAPTPTRTVPPTPTLEPTPTLGPTPTPSLSPTTPTPTPKVTAAASPTPVPTCAASALNLVKNPSFESVTGPGFQWQVLDAGTTKVPYWTQAQASVIPPFVGPNGVVGGMNLSAFLGAKYAMVHNGSAPQFQGIIGRLSTTTNVGSTYLLSARIAQWGGNASVFYLRLRQSGTGVESAALNKLIFPQITWKLITGTVTTPAGYDQVVLRWAPNNDSHSASLGLFDDVHVCKIGSARPWWWNTWLLVGILLLLVTVIGGLTAFVRKRREHHYIGTVTLVK